jgi:hypothetical protein
MLTVPLINSSQPNPMIRSRLAIVALALVAHAGPALSQDSSVARSMSGPRVGVTVFSQDLARRIESEFNRDNVVPIVTQFGWQSETNVLGNDKGGAAVVEWIFLVGGAEQGLFLPSLTMLIGGRSSTGAEFGLGPNLSLTGIGMAFGAGVTRHSGNIAIPINVAIVTGRLGLRVNLISGFNWRRN